MCMHSVRFAHTQRIFTYVCYVIKWLAAMMATDYIYCEPGTEVYCEYTLIFTLKCKKKLQSRTYLECFKLCFILLYIYIYIYTGCPRRNVPDFVRVFLRSNYTDITQNTYIQSGTITEIMAREIWNFDSYYSLIDYQIHIETGRNMWFL